MLNCVLSDFYCPLTHKKMIDPVVAEDGHTYERIKIQEWLSNAASGVGELLSPVTYQPMGTKLVSNLALKSVMEKCFVAANGKRDYLVLQNFCSLESNKMIVDFETTTLHDLFVYIARKEQQCVPNIRILSPKFGSCQTRDAGMKLCALGLTMKSSLNIVYMVKPKTNASILVHIVNVRSALTLDIHCDRENTIRCLKELIHWEIGGDLQAKERLKLCPKNRPFYFLEDRFTLKDYGMKNDEVLEAFYVWC